MKRTRGLLLITTFGLGRVRPAPGTWGSLPPVAVAAVMVALGLSPPVCAHGGAWWYGAMALMALVFSGACIARADLAEAVFGKKDPSEVVADETAAMALTIALLPHFLLVTPERALLTLAGAFVAFRVADVLKVWPASGLQRVPGGWGILLDDLVAAVQAAAAVWLVGWALVR